MIALAVLTPIPQCLHLRAAQRSLDITIMQRAQPNGGNNYHATATINNQSNRCSPTAEATIMQRTVQPNGANQPDANTRRKLQVQPNGVTCSPTAPKGEQPEMLGASQVQSVVSNWDTTRYLLRMRNMIDRVKGILTVRADNFFKCDCMYSWPETDLLCFLWRTKDQ